MNNATVIDQTAFTGADGNDYVVDLTDCGTVVLWADEDDEPLTEFAVSAIRADRVLLGTDRFLDGDDYAILQRLARVI
jgi:hypothetical protein